jgi:hypothetical protein
MIMKKVAVIVTVVCALSSPALADDAEKSAVLRDLGMSFPQGAQPSDASALAVPTTRAPWRSAQVRARQPAQLGMSSPSAIDLNLIGHN